MCAQVTEFRMKLSDRMQTIADRVEPGEVVADVGTDHGQVPVWLFARGICPRAILTDISEGSIRKAEETAAAYQFGSGLSFRVGNGLEVLEPAEADAVIIAGMGGKLIRQILDADPDHTGSFRKLILQPRKGFGPLRQWLVEHGWRIIREDVVREGNFLPEIITAVRPAMAGDPPAVDLAEREREHLMGLEEQDIRLRVPVWMTRAHGPLEDFFRLRLSQEHLILDNMRRARDRDLAAERRVEENIEYLKGLQAEITEI